MYLSGGSKSTDELARRVELVDLAVRRGGRIQAAAGRERKRVDLELFGIEEDRAFAGRVYAVHLAFVAAADVHRAVGRADHRPEERRAGVVDRGRRGPERQPPITVDRKVFDIALGEFGLVGDLPEGGLAAYASDTPAQTAASANATREVLLDI